MKIDLKNDPKLFGVPDSFKEGTVAEMRECLIREFHSVSATAAKTNAWPYVERIIREIKYADELIQQENSNA